MMIDKSKWGSFPCGVIFHFPPHRYGWERRIIDSRDHQNMLVSMIRDDELWSEDTRGHFHDFEWVLKEMSTDDISAALERVETDEVAAFLGHIAKLMRDEGHRGRK